MLYAGGGRTPLCHLFFSPSTCRPLPTASRVFFLPRLSGFGNGVLQGGGCQLCHYVFLSAFRIWKTPSHCVIDLFCSLGLPNLETGWCVCYNRGGDPVNFVIDIFPQFHCVIDLFSPSQLCHRSSPPPPDTSNPPFFSCRGRHPPPSRHIEPPFSVHRGSSVFGR